MLTFETIDPVKHGEMAIKFRRDSFVCSFGTDKDFGDDQEYLEWVDQLVKKFPNGFVMVRQGDQLIGQLELQIMKYENREIGYVNLYYLIPEYRGRGLGKQLHQYAINFFTDYQVAEFHLRVSPGNKQAMSFYRKRGMSEIGNEIDGKVIRMRGIV